MGAGVAAFKVRHVLTLKVDETSVIAEHNIKKAEPLKAFKQCGGIAYKGPTCCMKGCACIQESKYFSGCHAPLQMGHCDPDSVKDEAVAAKERLEQAKEDVKVAEAKVKDAEDWLADSQKASEEAEAAAERATKKGLEKRKEKEAAMYKFGEKVRELQEAADKELEGVKYSAHEKKMVKINAAKDKEAKIVKTAKAEKEAARKKVKEAQVKAQKAQHALDLKIKESAGVTKEVQDFWDKEGARKTQQCGGAFADCSKNWCCALSCGCSGKNKYYAQCTGLGGKSFCDAGP